MSQVTPHTVFNQQIKQLYDLGISALIGMPIAAVLSIIVLLNKVPLNSLLIWFALIILLSLLRLLLLNGYRRSEDALTQGRRWARYYFFLEIASGLAWGSLIYWLFPDTVIHQVVVMLIYTGMMAGAAPMLMPVKQIYAAYAFSSSITVTLSLFAVGSEYTNYLGFASVIYTLVLWFSTSLNSDNNTRAIRLMLENTELLKSMQHKQDQLLAQIKVTEEAEHKAVEAKARFQTLANATNEGVVLYEDGRIIDCNENITAMLGYPRTELLQKKIEQLFVRQDQDLLHDLLKHKDGILYELKGERKDGSYFPLEMMKRKLPLEDRTIHVFTLRDISELKYISEIKEQFVSTVSHELRTPITSIHASLGLALGGIAGEIPDKLQSLLSIAYQNSERLNLLINDLLDIQKLDGGQLHFNFEFLDVIEMLEQCIELNASYFDKHHIDVVLKDSSKGILINIDRDRFIQVLTNLLSNAAKFSPANSQVTIALEQQNDSIQIHIHNHGIGIPKEFQEKIFQRFSQADSSSSRSHGGSGLGLYISKQILAKMDGEISFRSEPGEGTTFTICLPVVKQ